MGSPASFSNATQHSGGFWEITIDDLKGLDASIRRIDVREGKELVGEMDLLAGTEHVPMGDVPKASGEWDKSSPLVVICRSGGRSARIALWLQERGFDDVVSLRGGMLAWNGVEI